ncbi:MAG: aminotransferase class V-fold PLP-dependent enzyme [Planctomycetota bacterium]
MPAIIYLDNAATSSPKPPEVIEAVRACLADVNANPGRSGHRLAVRAAALIFECREELAAFFNVDDSARVILLPNSTAALNLVIQGLLRDGGHAVTSSFEHNSVARPLEELKHRGVADYTVVSTPDLAALTPALIDRAVRTDTRLIALNGTSNVTGHHAPLAAIAAYARDRKVPLLVDGSQTAGTAPVDLAALGIDYFAFTGHKRLMGPQGTGGLVVRDPDRLPVFLAGGTGSRSAALLQPEFAPDKFEAGTPNTPGIAGLAAGVRLVRAAGLDRTIAAAVRITDRCRAGLGAIPGVTLQTGPGGAPVVSFTVAGRTPDEVAYALDREHGILCRPGIHCAPLAHQSLGTMPQGTVRFSFSPATTPAEIDTAVAAVAAIAKARP